MRTEARGAGEIKEVEKQGVWWGGALWKRMGAEKIAFRGNRQKENVQWCEWSGGELTGEEEEDGCGNHS